MSVILAFQYFINYIIFNYILITSLQHSLFPR